MHLSAPVPQRHSFFISVNLFLFSLIPSLSWSFCFSIFIPAVVFHIFFSFLYFLPLLSSLSSLSIWISSVAYHPPSFILSLHLQIHNCKYFSILFTTNFSIYWFSFFKPILNSFTMRNGHEPIQNFLVYLRWLSL